MIRPCSRRASSLTKLAIALAASAALASCWVPVYDPAVSLSSKLEKKLEPVLRIGPVTEYFEEREEAELRFIPFREASPRGGFAFVLYPDFIEMKAYFGSGSQPLRSFSWRSSFINELGLRAGTWAQDQVAGFPDRFDCLVISNSSVSGFSDYGPTILQYDTLTGSIGLYAIDDVGTNSSTRKLIATGRSRRASDLATDDVGYFQYDDAAMEYQGGAFEILNGLGHNAAGSETVNTGGQVIVRGTFVSKSLFGYYLSGYGPNGKAITLRWSSGFSAAPTVLPTDQAIDELLSDGKLLARENLVTYVYDSNGYPLFTIPTGILRFVHEVNDGGIWYSYFSRGTRLSTKDGAEYYFDVFRYPTAQLSDLAQ